ncbi:MAG TPA: cysteine dioxygenase family protein [Thermoanaerobaculia bacterium]|jgi:predicted metal-dependent enzyme (double-stranded beta helix superfamily)
MNFSQSVKEVILDAAVKPERLTPSLLCDKVARELEKHLDRIQFSGQRYMRHPILLWEDWEVMLIAWQSGQVTPIHDHRGVMGGMVVLSGTLAEERFATPKDRPELYDNRARPEGDLSDIGPTVLHRLAPTSARAVSLHVYRPPLRTMGIWDASGMLAIMPSAFDVGEEVLAHADAVSVTP